MDWPSKSKRQPQPSLKPRQSTHPGHNSTTIKGLKWRKLREFLKRLTMKNSTNSPPESYRTILSRLNKSHQKLQLKKTNKGGTRGRYRRKTKKHLKRNMHYRRKSRRKG